MSTELYIGTSLEDLNGKIDFEAFKGLKKEDVIFKGESKVKDKIEFVLIYKKSVSSN